MSWAQIELCFLAKSQQRLNKQTKQPGRWTMNRLAKWGIAATAAMALIVTPAAMANEVGQEAEAAPAGEATAVDYDDDYDYGDDAEFFPPVDIVKPDPEFGELTITGDWGCFPEGGGYLEVLTIPWARYPVPGDEKNPWILGEPEYGVPVASTIDLTEEECPPQVVEPEDGDGQGGQDGGQSGDNENDPGATDDTGQGGTGDGSETTPTPPPADDQGESQSGTQSPAAPQTPGTNHQVTATAQPAQLAKTGVGQVVLMAALGLGAVGLGVYLVIRKSNWL